jgi:hypothetical protein
MWIHKKKFAQPKNALANPPAPPPNLEMILQLLLANNNPLFSLLSHSLFCVRCICAYVFNFKYKLRSTSEHMRALGKSNPSGLMVTGTTLITHVDFETTIEVVVGVQN